jgi:hypothetical protein
LDAYSSPSSGFSSKKRSHGAKLKSLILSDELRPKSAASKLHGPKVPVHGHRRKKSVSCFDDGGGGNGRSNSNNHKEAEKEEDVAGVPPVPQPPPSVPGPRSYFQMPKFRRPRALQSSANKVVSALARPITAANAGPVALPSTRLPTHRTVEPVDDQVTPDDKSCVTEKEKMVNGGGGAGDASELAVPGGLPPHPQVGAKKGHQRSRSDMSSMYSSPKVAADMNLNVNLEPKLTPPTVPRKELGLRHNFSVPGEPQDPSLWMTKKWNVVLIARGASSFIHV